MARYFLLKKETARHLQKIQRKDITSPHGSGLPAVSSAPYFQRIYKGQTTVTHAAGATQPVTRYKPNDTLGTATDQVKNPFSFSIASGRLVFYIFINGSFQILIPDC